jgi:hypothetical protein
MYQASLFITQSVFPIELGCFSPLQVRVHMGCFEELMPHASVDRKYQGFANAWKSEVEG